MDLSTTYLGMKLKNPIVPSASPLSRSVSSIRKLEDAGAAAVVLYSLFEEELNQESRTLDRYLTEGTESYAEALSYFPEAPTYTEIGPDSYLEHIHRVKKAVDIPIIASLNGVSTGGWVKFAKEIEGAGADALELNVYYLPTILELTGVEVEQIYIDILKDVKSVINIPVAVKLSPFFSATANMMKKLVDNGADGLVMFNRFYQPDLDLENLEVTPHLVLSTSEAMRLPMRWIAILYGRLNADFALTSGAHTADDALKAVAAGASVVQMAAELLKNGAGRIGEVLAEMSDWLYEHEYESLDVLKGSLSQINVSFPAAFERANYLEIVRSYSPTF
ncbi:MAG: dihydroorotate dehydrogenase-like protein [Candidatus Promineifilaceae bacterium]|jgi:dihydroorotate dehydrogenase (fumarate)